MERRKPENKFNVFEDETKQKYWKRSDPTATESNRYVPSTHITLDETVAVLPWGDFRNLNIILKGDVDESVEALTDSFLKLSNRRNSSKHYPYRRWTITESDVLWPQPPMPSSSGLTYGLWATPANWPRKKKSISAVIPSSTMPSTTWRMPEGMLSPELREEVTGTAEIRETFKISKVGTILQDAWCISGKIFRIRAFVWSVKAWWCIPANWIVKTLQGRCERSLQGLADCGMQVKNYNDIKEGDIIEAFRK